MPVDLEQPSTCTPMNGYMTVWSRTGRRQLNEAALDAIQNYVESSSSFISDEVLAISYIGTRDVVSVGIMNPDILARHGDRTLAVKFKSFHSMDISAAVTVTTVFIAVCVAVRRFVKSNKVANHDSSPSNNGKPY